MENNIERKRNVNSDETYTQLNLFNAQESNSPINPDRPF